MIKASVIGGTGYMGFELLRILSMHPDVELSEVTSRSSAGKKVAQVYPALGRVIDKEYVSEISHPEESDVVFVAAPHGSSMEVVPGLLSAGCRVIDLSGDYRLGNAEEYEKWYGKEHTDSANLSKAVYGLTELNRGEIKDAQLVANPGCYPTGALLALIPLAWSNAISGDVIIDSKSGTSGAGATPGDFTHHPAVAANVMPYKVGSHRHLPEIENILRQISSTVGDVSFTPHLVPIVRGIQTSCYVRVSSDADFDGILKHYRVFAENNRFVRLVDGVPRLPSVIGSNYCDLSVMKVSKNLVSAFSAIDNLCKGGSGQAVQNMNVMFGLDEMAGLGSPGLGV